MNDKLIELYVTNYTRRKGIVVNKGEFVLNKLAELDVSYSVEIQSEYINEREGSCCITVVMYLPGAAITGIGTSCNPDFVKARKLAYAEAVKAACSFYGIEFETKDKPQQPSNSQSQLPPPIDEPVNNDTPPEEPKKASKFTPEQIAGMKAIKEEFGINDDETFNRYLRSWNSEVTNKKMLTPDNIDDFLNFMREGSI